jgi:phosphatidate cytidylyltransferase
LSDFDRNAKGENAGFDSDGNGAALDNSEVEEIDCNKRGMQEKPKDPITLNKILIRSATATALACLYMSIVNAGHFYCILAVALTQTQLYREIVNVRYVEARERAMPWFRSLQWSWFIGAMILVYGETLHRFCGDHKTLNRFLPYTENFSHIVYILYWIVFVASVLTLKPGLIRFQLSQHMWSIVTVCLVVFQCKYFPSNTLNGIFWFFFPMACVIMNDVSAYFVGITFGRKFINAPFLQLSPNKTWEGFIGACLCTLIFSFIFPAILSQHTWFICPAEHLNIWPFPAKLICDPNPVFVSQEYSLPVIGTINLFPIQFHGLAYGLFASLVAPFGGFFASAIKRAYRKKDFDSFMPGHGGMMDRMDCQLLMITFSSFYYGFFIMPKAFPLDRMIMLATDLSDENKLALATELLKQLGRIV